MKKGFWLYLTLAALGFVGCYLLVESGAATWRAVVVPVVFIAIGAIKYKIWVL